MSDRRTVAPRLSAAAIRANHARLQQRRELFRRHGLDHALVRRFVLAQSGKLRQPLLEIGTGRGLTALALARAGHTFTSVDRDRTTLHIAALNLAHARLRSRVTLRQMDAYALDFPDASVGTIIMIDALHHLHDGTALCRTFDRVLKPGGKLVLADLNAHGQRVVAGIHRGEGRRHRLSPLTLASMRRRLARRGYRLTVRENDTHWLLLAVKRRD